MTKLLITGFGPFPRVPRNPSGLLAEHVAASPRLRLAGIRASALVLPTTYGAVDAMLRPAIAREVPDAVLMIGVAARRREVCVERQALNRVSRLFPDASGTVGPLVVFLHVPLPRGARPGDRRPSLAEMAHAIDEAALVLARAAAARRRLSGRR